MSIVRVLKEGLNKQEDRLKYIRSHLETAMNHNIANTSSKKRKKTIAAIPVNKDKGGTDSNSTSTGTSTKVARQTLLEFGASSQNNTEETTTEEKDDNNCSMDTQ